MFTHAQERANRILSEKLRILYQGVFAVPANLVIACVVAFMLRHSFPHFLLGVWIAATALVAGLRLLLHRRFVRRVDEGQEGARWAPLFCAGSFASGTLWGALCLGLPFWGSANDYVLMTLVAAGMTAGALTTIAAYLPAFVCYACAFIVPLASVSLLNADGDIAANGALMVMYIVMICFAGKNLSRSVHRTIEMQVDNEALQGSLTQTRIERDEARTEKWSTLAQLSHELRTPLNAIMGFSEAMREQMFGPLGNTRYREYATHIHGSGQHLLTLISEILQLSQGEAGKLELHEGDVDLAAVADNCLALLSPAAQKADLTVKVVTASALPHLRADETKLRQILLNLVNNAIKFTPPGGEISVGIGEAVDGGIDLVVRDTGIGMRSEDIPLALQPFGRVASPLKHKTEGMGLGLPICKRLAELHGASLSIDSKLGEGTVCTVAFPASRRIGAADKNVQSGELVERIARIA